MMKIVELEMVSDWLGDYHLSRQQHRIFLNRTKLTMFGEDSAYDEGACGRMKKHAAVAFLSLFLHVLRMGFLI